MRSVASTFVLVLAVVAGLGCEGRGNVLVTGRLTRHTPRDSVFVTLTHNWQNILMAPTRFNLRKTGHFELEFTVGRRPPPITFISNNTVYAKLTVHGLWDPSPVLIDEISGQVFDLTYEGNGQFRAEVKL